MSNPSDLKTPREWAEETGNRRRGFYLKGKRKERVYVWGGYSIAHTVASQREGWNILGGLPHEASRECPFEGTMTRAQYLAALSGPTSPDLTLEGDD